MRPTRRRAADSHKTRVLTVMPALIYGGGQFQVLRQFQNMDPERFEHTIAYVLPRNEMEPDFRRAGLRTVNLGHRGFLFAPRTLFRLLRLVKRQRIDVVHTNTRYDRIYGQLAALLCGVPVVNSLHGEFSTSHYENLRTEGWLRRPFTRARLALEDWLEVRTVVQVIAVSKGGRAAWLSHPRSRRIANGSVEIVYTGVPLDVFDISRGSPSVESLRVELGLDGRGPVLLNVARLRAGKGQRYLVGLTKRVRQRHPGAVTLVAGEGSARRELEREITSAGLDDAIVLLGHRNDVPELLALSDLFVFPSLSEGFGNAVLEAHASGTAVVAFDLPPFRDFVNEFTGRLVPIGDERALAEACLELLDDSDLAAAMGEAGREQAAARFDVRKWTARLGSIYERVADRSAAKVTDADWWSWCRGRTRRAEPGRSMTGSPEAEGVVGQIDRR